MEQCRSNPRFLMERAITDIYLNNPRSDVFFWVGPDWYWSPADDYLSRLAKVEAVLRRPATLKEIAPIGISDNMRHVLPGCIFDFPKEFTIKLIRAINRTNDNGNDSQILMDGARKYMELEAMCDGSDFKPVYLIRSIGSKEYMPEAIICPTEADATLVSAFWSS